MAMTRSRRLMPFPAARHVLGDIGRTTLYELVNDGEIVKVNIGRRGFITSESLDAYMDRLTASAGHDRTGRNEHHQGPDEDLAEADHLEAQARRTDDPHEGAGRWLGMAEDEPPVGLGEPGPTPGRRSWPPPQPKAQDAVAAHLNT